MALRIPIFPLGTVLYPGGRLRLHIFEPRYVVMTQRCLGEDSVFGVSLILDGREVGQPAVPHALGCTARIVDWAQIEPGLYALTAVGESAFRILRREVMADGLTVADVEILPPPAPQPVPEVHAPLVRLLQQLIEQPGAEPLVPPLRLDEGGWVAQRLAERLPLPAAARQRVLESTDAEEQLAVVAAALAGLRRGG
ncbi:MAG: LON peptidase substrate-binding domain-containing protein [Nevskiales bacterium]|nr:LON peptidase substrate-binding domain-containing protein [Nevskiales bacterium]